MKVVALSLAGCIFLLLAFFLFGLGFTTTYAFSDQRVRLPDGAVVTVTPQPDWGYEPGWLSTSTMKDTTSFFVSYDLGVAERYQVALVNAGHAYSVPHACGEWGCGGHVEGPQPVVGRDVRLCFQPKAGGAMRCGAVDFTYGKSVELTRWVAITGI